MPLRRTIQTPVGTDVESAAISVGHIEGIRIDNPSGSWLFVTGIDQFVPPYITGWQYPVQPGQTAISVRFVDSPSGSLSVQEGGAPTIYLWDSPLDYDPGQPSGSGARVTIVPPFLTAAVGNVLASRLGTNTLVIAATTRPIILRRLGLVYDPFSGSTFPSGWFEEQTRVIGQWEVAANPYGMPITFEWRQAISLESPFVSEEIEDGAVRIAVGRGLFFNGFATPLGGSTAVIPQVQYYEERE